MMEVIISSVVTLFVCLINNNYQQRQVREQNDKTIALIAYRLDELSKRVEKHNNVIERTYELEKAIGIDAEKIRVANHRIDDLERKVD